VGDRLVVDLRSDTVTRPTAGMREAMAAAEVGDDVYGEDPTVNALEAEVAALFGHEAALFAPTGSMANQIALQLVVPPGDELLCDADAHVVTYEIGAAAAYGGISSRTWPAAGADLDPGVVAGMVRQDGYFAVPTRAIAVEQTHNRGGGGVIPLATLRELRRVADADGLALHCDGARIWHAHVADRVPLAEYGALFDTLSVCLSKGLGAPVGSMLATPAELIDQARHERKRLGGSMRQSGILAAAGLLALEHHVERLDEDHARARALADAVAERFPDAGLDPATVTTNVVVFAPPDAPKLVEHLHADGVLAGTIAPGVVRLMTHLDVDDAALAHAIEALRAF
jgi:threonine aldolase